MPTIDWTERPDRDPISVAGSILIGGRNLVVILINVSRDGCQIECEEPLPIGVTVRLKVGAVSIAAVIRWSTFGKAGLRFVR